MSYVATADCWGICADMILIIKQIAIVPFALLKG